MGSSPISPPPAITTVHAAQGMGRLPVELLKRIFTNTDISRDDLKSLRLVCRSTMIHATQLLFYRVCISKLKTDRDAFLNISTQPLLAAAVRVLVWYELAEDESSFQIERPGQMTGDISSVLITQTRNLFWMSTKNLHDAEIGEDALQAKIAAVEEFQPHFYTALDAMPGLHTVISQPMHPYRRLTRSPTDYPLTAQLLQRGMTHGQEQMNEGFYTFLIPAMEHRFLANLPITRLHFADEDHLTSLIRLQSVHLSAFTALRHIDLCVSRIENSSDLQSLSECLCVAMNLSHLRLCFERSNDTSTFPDGKESPTVLDALLCHSKAYWPRLRDLHLDDLRLPMGSLLRFLKKHALSLKRLRADSCNLNRHIIAAMAKIEGLRLESFVALGAESFRDDSAALEDDESIDDGDDMCYIIPEAEILAFLNSGGANRVLAQKVYERARTCLRTHASVFDLEGWATAAICDSRDQEAWQRGYNHDEIKMLDLENGDRRDAEGIAFEKRGYWEFDKNGDLEMLDVAEGNEEYAREQISYLKLLHDSPHWRLCRDDNGNGDVYFWMASNEDGGGEVGHQTEMWWFQHRNGEVALGHDPLEFWEDWEGSCAGDSAEASPFRRDFQGPKAIHTEHDSTQAETHSL